MDALAGYGSDEADTTEISPASTNTKKRETNPEIISTDVQQDRTNGEERKRSKKHSVVDDGPSKPTSLKYEKRELDCTINAEITTREAANGQLMNQQANTKTSADEGKHKERTRHRSRSRSKSRSRSRSRSRSGHRSSRSKSRSAERSSKHKGRRSRSREHSRSPRSRSRSRSRSPSHRGQKHARHGNKRSNRLIDSRKCRDSHRRKRRSRSRSTSRRRATRSRSRERKRHSRSRSHERNSRRSRSRSRNRHSRRSRSREKPTRHRSRSRDRSSKRHETTRNAKSEPSEAPASTTNDTQKKNAELIVETSSKLPLKINLSGSGQMTPQLAVQQAMAAVNAKAQQLTGISLPKYYNPAAVNPMKYAEQMQKRKLLWNCNKDKQVQPVVVQTTSNNKWEKTTFAQDLDGKMTAKFRKLMGIKSDEAGEEIVQEGKNVSEEQIRKQEEMFRKLDQQYEVARMSTHTHRGVGLGFSSQSHHLFPK